MHWEVHSSRAPCRAEPQMNCSIADGHCQVLCAMQWRELVLWPGLNRQHRTQPKTKVEKMFNAGTTGIVQQCRLRKERSQTLCWYHGISGGFS